MVEVHPDVWQEAKRALGFEYVPDDELTEEQIRLIENFIRSNYDRYAYVGSDD